MPPQVKDAKQKQRRGKGKSTKPTSVPAASASLVSLPQVPHTGRATNSPHRILNPSLSDPASPHLPTGTGHLASNPLGGGGTSVFGIPVPDPLTPFGENIPGMPGIGGLLDQAGKAVPDLPSPLSGISNAAHSLSATLDWLTNPARLIKVLGGGILILMGLHQLTKILTGSTPGGLVKGGAGAASGAAAGGGAVKAAEGVGEKLAAVAAL